MPASCSTCNFRRPRVTPLTLIGEPVGEALQLTCIARPPSADPVTGLALWPVVKPTEVCAAHPDFEPAPPPPAAQAQADLPL